MPTTAGSVLRQLSSKEGWKATSRRWNGVDNRDCRGEGGGRGGGGGVAERNNWMQMEGLRKYGGAAGSGGGLVVRKRVMVVVDHSSRSKHAMMWALTHVANKGDLLALLHVVSPPMDGDSHKSSDAPYLATSLGSLCKACRPEVEVEALVIRGPKLATVLHQVKKLEVSVLVLGQNKPSPILNCLLGMRSSDEFVQQCINNADCLTIGVRRQSKGTGGYLVSTRWQKNFWLLA